ncbi:MAG: DUF2752 domain-containing protein [Candidatus Cloacimonetes bacterium]|nr:DUF2752 domain-containing protein [Candidatus Cloacimonadota bacterium]
MPSSHDNTSLQTAERTTPMSMKWVQVILIKIHNSYRIISFISISLILACLTILSFSNPESWAPVYRCPVYSLMGIKCPGCGSMRALYHLIHGDIKSALGYNFVTIFMLPVLLISFSMGLFMGRELRPNIRIYKILTSTFLFLLIGFTIVRNIITIL